ncbi:23S rRNA (adenine(2030)-N(6))-methyltransferase RlmJ [Pelagibacterium montanilacus]|uniref:23S rRNA (adenine(2030)-N(6))-methyltransferase RlmJ n=1 Tax=Pelagibacterium montanilacus TaxID=2185280 RepID=UPI000F8CCCA1|nr:23S rRNA (adenine(2030)-N(6))-methyltransferase RlmJ [Pelagibacterium montanilacus]
MNYRHAFHAGNFADVVKHVTLTRILVYLMVKDAAFRVIDTHAGVGLYDLWGSEADRTGEWREGIARLTRAELAAPAGALIAPYLDAVRAQNTDNELRYYPGSPFVVRHMLRKQDRLMALELHPEDAEALRCNFAGDIQTRVTQLDGWAALGTHLPPKERRGLVLVDPPFEQKGEFERMVGALERAHKRWPTGIYAFWYPVKDTTEVSRYIRALAATGIPKILRLELTIRPASSPPRLHGSGMIVVNPPFVLRAEMEKILPALSGLLAEAGRGRYRIEEIAGEG